VSSINVDVACRALALAEGSGGLRRMAALCVAIAAATTGTVVGASKALEIILHPDLLVAAQSLLTELADEPAADEPATDEPGAEEAAAAAEPVAESIAVMQAVAASL